MSCSVHEKCSNLTGVPWRRGTGASFLLFIGRNYIFSFYLCDKKFIKVNVKPTFYCSLLQVMSVNTCLIYRCLSSASAVIRSWFIYELQKSTTIAFSRITYSTLSTPEIPPVEFPHTFGFPIVNTPHAFRIP